MTKKERTKLFEDVAVSKALFTLATEGYNYAEQVIYKADDGNVYLVTTTRHVPPSVEAQIFWLCNRRPENWMIGDEAMAQVIGKVNDQLDAYVKNKTH